MRYHLYSIRWQLSMIGTNLEMCVCVSFETFLVGTFCKYCCGINRVNLRKTLINCTANILLFFFRLFVEQSVCWNPNKIKTVFCVCLLACVFTCAFFVFLSHTSRRQDRVSYSFQFTSMHLICSVWLSSDSCFSHGFRSKWNREEEDGTWRPERV